MEEKNYIVEDLKNIFKDVPDPILRWVIGLSMAANDLALSVKLMKNYEDLAPESHYFFRLSLSHLREVANFVKRYSKNNGIQDFLKSLDAETQQMYSEITETLIPLEQGGITKDILLPIRNSCFHYPSEDGSLFKDWPGVLKELTEIEVRFDKNDKTILGTRYIFADVVVSKKVNNCLSKETTDKISYIAFHTVQFVDRVLHFLKNKK